ncbi:uncharacterized protein LOC110025232 [Phalaenopsis equestris]|uniref:uncharacterized protein LOC110025232 n=1 Tax=Phalaenopsis equestris TaxID=78828 RepID=UPI0009E35AAB|nr:uncharacterized protein LOC110025232 [Phalaenopsis equestris]
MDKLGRKQVPIGLRKEKKKQVKDEVDRLKQAEKKKRRLEKALATSAAIRSELEKKKMKKMEEQQRLDAEGAATAEAVALHVLLGEDADESSQIMRDNIKRFNYFDNSGNLGHLMDQHSSAKYSIGETGRISYAYASRNKWNDWANESSFSSVMHGKDLNVPYFEEMELDAEDSAGLMAARAVSSLCITDNSQNLFPGQNTATTVINSMVPGHDFDSKFSLFKFF